MAVQISIDYDGKTYLSKPSEEATALETKDAIFEVIAQMNKLELELETGDFLVMGGRALQSAVLLFKEI